MWNVDLSCGVCSTDAGAAAAMELELAAIEAAMLSPRSSGTASEASEYDDDDESDSEADHDGDETMMSSGDSTELRAYEQMGRLAAEKAKIAGASPQKRSPNKLLVEMKVGEKLASLAESPRSRLHQRLGAIHLHVLRLVL